MPDSSVVESIRRKFDSLSHLMDERARRCWAAAEAMELGWGGGGGHGIGLGRRIRSFSCDIDVADDDH